MVLISFLLVLLIVFLVIAFKLKKDKLELIDSNVEITNAITVEQHKSDSLSGVIVSIGIIEAEVRAREAKKQLSYDSLKREYKKLQYNSNYEASDIKHYTILELDSFWSAGH